MDSNLRSGSISDAAPQRGPRDWQAWGALLLVALIVPFFELGDFRTLGSHEAYAVVPAQEMLESGDWVVPTFGGLPRLQKPPLGYWLIAASSWIMGGVSELSARVPAALASVGLAALLGYCAARWYGKRVGYCAALVQLTSVWAIDFGRKAEVDMALCLLTTAAMVLIAGDPGPAGRGPTADCDPRKPGDGLLSAALSPRWTGIYALLAIAWLAKFYYAAAMVCAPVVLYWLLERRWRSFFHWLNPAGLLLLAAAAGIWPWLVWRQIPDAAAIWKAETIGRAVGELDVKPLWYYLPHLMAMTLPWSPWALWTIPRSWKSAWKQGDPRERFLWVWLITQNAILAFQANKHPNYLMASLPVVTLFAARGVAAFAEQLRERGAILSRQAVVLSIILYLAGSATAATLLARKWPWLAAGAIAVALIFAIGGCVALGLLQARRNRAAALVTCGFSLACYMGITGWIVPARDHRRAEAEFARAVRSGVDPGQSVCAYRLGMSWVVFYADSPTFRIESPAELAQRLADGGTLSIVTRAPQVDELRELGELRIVRRFEEHPDLPKLREPPLVHVELRRADARLADRP